AFAPMELGIDEAFVTKLKQAGTISLGKTATPEFGAPCYTEPEGHPPARTPWDLTRSAGGSSGGAGAAVASGLLPAAPGGDGGGDVSRGVRPGAEGPAHRPLHHAGGARCGRRTGVRRGLRARVAAARVARPHGRGPSDDLRSRADRDVREPLVGGVRVPAGA